MSRCPHGYELEDLRTGASVCEKCSETHRPSNEKTIVAQLRAHVASWPKSSRWFYREQIEAISLAADEIERLTRERGRFEQHYRDQLADASRHHHQRIEAEQERDRLRAALEHVRASAQTGTYEGGVVISFAAFASVREALSGEPGSAVETTARREPDWHCTHCGRDNDPSETHCVQCEWSRKHTIAGVLHERDCMGSPCRCGAESAVKASGEPT